MEDLQDQTLDENATLFFSQRWNFILIHYKITFIHT